MRLLTIDSSVFVSAARPTEPSNAESLAFLAWVRRNVRAIFAHVSTGGGGRGAEFNGQRGKLGSTIRAVDRATSQSCSSRWMRVWPGSRLPLALNTACEVLMRRF